MRKFKFCVSPLVKRYPAGVQTGLSKCLYVHRYNSYTTTQTQNKNQENKTHVQKNFASRTVWSEYLLV